MTEKNEQKNVLMFCSAFFGYDKRIAAALESEGYSVDLFDERPNNDFITKSCIRYNVKLFRPVLARYIESVIASSEKNYDYVFVIKGEAIDETCLALLKKAYPNAKFILYLWDSVSNVVECESRFQYYDRVLSFDPVDAEKYNLIFRPLFFADEYNARVAEKKKYRYAFSFVGTAHTLRPRIVGELKKQCAEKGRECFSFLYLPHRMVYWYNKFLNPDYRKVKKSDISFSPLDPDQIRSVYEDTACVLDVEHVKQRGLTMRTIELVGMKKKIITTNALIRDYDFYNPKNIFVISRKDPAVDDAFFDSEYEEIPLEISQRYSIDYFVREIFSV